METLGSLIDKLSITNIKLYHQEDIRHSDPDDKKRLRASDAICVLNTQRNTLIDRIDELFLEALRNPEKARTFSQMKDYSSKK